MPCDSSHMEPTARELHRKEAARLLVYLHKELDAPAPAWAVEYAKHIYGGPETDKDRAVAALRDKLRTLNRDNPGYFNAIVYDGESRDSRRLADWWEDHLEEDAKAGRGEEGSGQGTFLLFVGSEFYPLGGWEDYVGTFTTLEDAKEEAHKLAASGNYVYMWAHVVDTNTDRVVWEQESDKN